MSKRNVAFTKPDEPAFLKRIKEQISYKEGPSVDTKRQKLEDEYQSGDDNIDEEAPLVVVLKDGDLTAEQAEAEKRRIEKEEAEKPADLTERVIFKPKPKKQIDLDIDNLASGSKIKDKKKRDKKFTKNKLSFNDNDEEENDSN